MALSEKAASALAKQLLEVRSSEAERLSKIRNYLRDDDTRRLPGLPTDVPAELIRLARVSRVNVLKFVVNSRVQAMYVDGFKTPRASDDVPAWDVWQRNKMDARQIGIHRAALSYGAAYGTAFPGDTAPVLRGASPRNMTVVYGDDDDWPVSALEKRRSPQVGQCVWRLIDETSVYWLRSDTVGEGMTLLDIEDHGVRVDGRPVCPVVRYRETEDLDDPVVGLVEPFTALQDQINITSFGLQVAQHYGAFRQRYIIGWLADTEEKRLKASASRLWTFDEDPSQVSIGEFAQTDLKGYIDSREATLRHLATVSQTPAHELLGQLVNLSAEALAAAEASQMRAIAENQAVLGEAHEQLLNVADEIAGRQPDPSAEVTWRDTESRSLAQVADALGKLVTMLGVPAQELWEMIPGVSQQQVERWKASAAEGDAFSQLTQILDRQAQPA